MVGLVLVSHSRALAEALVALVGQVSDAAALPVIGVGGAGPRHSELGTDATAIAEAIQALYTPDGVVVLMDLGSAVLSAEMAVELLPDAMRPNIHCCAAPLVEGAVAAAVRIGLNSSAATVCREAMAALTPKVEQLGHVDAQPDCQPATVGLKNTDAFEARIELTVQTCHGLHARPAARLVQTAAAFDADVFVARPASADGRGMRPVSAASMTALAGLGLRQGEAMLVMANGKQAQAALAAIAALVAANFGEDRPEPAKSIAVDDLAAIVPIAAGVALGPAICLHPTIPALPTHRIADSPQEWARLQRAIDVAVTHIDQRRRQIGANTGADPAAVFDAHRLILQDPAILNLARRLIDEDHLNAAQAWQAGIDQALRGYDGLTDDYLRQRAADVKDVSREVLIALLGAASNLAITETGIVVMPELAPNWVAQLNTEQVLGVVAVTGGPTSHGAILVRNLGIPAIVAPAAAAQISDGQMVGIDGSEGRLWIDPDRSTRGRLRQMRNQWMHQRRQLQTAGRRPAQTADGIAIAVAANVAGLADARSARLAGAEGIGILRSEFLFAERQTAPTQAEQIDILSRIGREMVPHPVYVRTLDAGGDKPIAYLNSPVEANPFLGMRSTRLMLRRPDVFNAQLRAILVAGIDLDIRVMFPMISTLADIEQALACLVRAHESLVSDKIAHRWPAPTAMMIETPAAALMTKLFADYVDFFSIGTNDLTQYTLAAERGNPALAEYADALHPAVLRLIELVVDAAHARGKKVGVCGEVGADAAAAPVLVGLGVDELSVNPGCIAAARNCIRRFSRQAAGVLAKDALQTRQASDVRRLADKFMNQSASMKNQLN